MTVPPKTTRASAPSPGNGGAETLLADAAVLRHRVGVLRELAGTIEATTAMSLDHDAGADTWAGPRPLLCHNVLLTNLMQVHGAVEDLRWHAWQLERRANEIEAAARALHAPASGVW